MTPKGELRALIKQAKAQLNANDIIKDGLAVGMIIEESAWFRNAAKIMTFHSLPDEICTHNHIDSWCNFKDLYLPRVNGNNLDIVKYSPMVMCQGAFNINEPIGEPADPQCLDLIIVPGMAFDLKGNRLGRGKGFYDRLLHATNALKIGIGHDFQLLEHIPSEPHDIKMDAIITPHNTIILNNKTTWQ